MKNTSIVKAGNQMSLFKPEAAVEGKLASVIGTRESKAGAQQLFLLPMKDMKAVAKCSGSALKAFRRERQDELKTWMCRELGGIQAASNWTGHGMRVNKSGNRLTFTFVRCDGAPAMKQEEMCKRLGITLDQLNAVKSGSAQPVTKAQIGAGEVLELKA